MGHKRAKEEFKLCYEKPGKEMVTTNTSFTKGTYCLVVAEVIIKEKISWKFAEVWVTTQWVL